MWAETSKREVSYALCNDRRTLLWFANQRAIEYHPTLFTVDRPDRITHLVLDLDPPDGDAFAAGRSRSRTSCGRRSPTSGSRARSRRAAPRACTSSCRSTITRRPRTRPRRRARSRRAPSGSIPSIATTAFMKEDRERQGVRRLDPRRRRDGHRGVQPARPARRPRVVPGRVGRSRRRHAGRLHRAHRARAARRRATRGPSRCRARSA